VSRENVEIVRAMYGEQDQMAAFAARSAPDVQVDLTDLHVDQATVKRGEVRRDPATSPWGTSLRFEPERYFDVDDERVLVFIRATATGQASGTPIDARVAQEFVFRHGQLVRFKVYRDRAEALKAVGLEE
jgi:ketosteroid isomerase-like protein